MTSFVPCTSFFGYRVHTQSHTCANSKSSRRPRTPTRAPARVTPSATWVKSSATVEVEVDPGFAYDVYSDIQEMPNWSPWLQEVRIDPNDGMLSTWVLAARGIEISWKARITANARGEIIAWRSESGLKNRGSVRFVPNTTAVNGSAAKATSTSNVTLAIEFDVPDFLAKAFDSNFIGRFVRETLAADLKRFRGAVLRSRRLKTIAEQSKKRGIN